jgi:hypothetical protein
MDKNEIGTYRMAAIDCFEIGGEKFKVEIDTVIRGPDSIIRASFGNNNKEQLDNLIYIAQHSYFRRFRECLDFIKKEGEKDNCAKDRVRKSIENSIYNERAKKDFVFYDGINEEIILCNIKKDLIKELVLSVDALIYNLGHETRNNAYLFLEETFGITKEIFNKIYLKCIMDTHLIIKTDRVDPVVKFRSFLANVIVAYIKSNGRNCK